MKSDDLPPVKSPPASTYRDLMAVFANLSQYDASQPQALEFTLPITISSDALLPSAHYGIGQGQARSNLARPLVLRKRFAPSSIKRFNVYISECRGYHFLNQAFRDVHPRVRLSTLAHDRYQAHAHETP